MEPLGVLADAYVRKLSSAQFDWQEPPARGSRDAVTLPGAVDPPRWRRAARAFRRVATALLG
jgi:hypothetical protein